MSKPSIIDESLMNLFIYEYVADEEDILKAYRTLGIDPYIESNATNVTSLAISITFIAFLNT